MNRKRVPLVRNHCTVLIGNGVPLSRILHLVSTTALTAAGAHIIIFTTGRGTPFGAPVPTIKISTNTALAVKKPGWIDFNAGTVADGDRDLYESARDLMNLVLEVASGKHTKTEDRGYREISIFKDGVVL